MKTEQSTSKDVKISIANHYVGGCFAAGSRQAIAATVNPATGEEVGVYATGSAEDVDQAVAAAREAFERGGWAASPRRRADVLYRMAGALSRRKEDVIRIGVAETGKLVREIEHEFRAGISELQYYAGLARAIFGRVQEVDEGQLSIFSREPAGVVAIIVPWNAPITLLIRSLAPALCAGCTVIVKPAPQTSLTNALLMEILGGVEGLPAGVLNSVNEAQREVGAAIAVHRDIDVISFTGSVATGKKIMQSAAGTLKRLSLELGGKSPAIVFADAPVEQAVATVVRCSMVMAGQMCTAVNRVLVADAIYEDFANRLTGQLSALRLGPGTDPASEMGPLISKQSRDRIAALGEIGDREGKMLLRGNIPGGALEKGAFISPTLVAVDNEQSPLVQDELFGPYLVIERFADETEAVRKANATLFGLSASVWTRDGALAQRVARAARFGTVWINSHNRLFAEAETGGFKQSGIGRLHGLEGLNDFLETKHIFSETKWLRSDGQ